MIAPLSWSKVRGYYHRKAAGLFFRRIVNVRPLRPVISFSFDDCPESAIRTGGAILKRYSLAGTYYTSLGLMGQESASGRMFQRADLDLVLEQGHELACHTFSHCHSGFTPP